MLRNQVKIFNTELRVKGDKFRLFDQNGNLTTSGLSNWLKRKGLNGYVPLILDIVKTGVFKENENIYRWDLFESYKSYLNK